MSIILDSDSKKSTDQVKTPLLTRIPSGRYTKWLVVAFWIAVIIFAYPLAGKLTGAESNSESTWLPSNAESTKEINIQDNFLSESKVPAVIVYERDSGLTKADKLKITADVKTFANAPHVNGTAQGPLFSKDGKAAEIFLDPDLGVNFWTGAGDYNDSLVKIAKTNAAGLQVHLAGPLGTAAASSKAFSGIDSTLLYSALAVVTILLLLTYRSPVLWLFPVISAGVALATAEAIIYLLAVHEGLVVNAQSAGILIVLVFGASTDYALLLIARFREELHRHADRHVAMSVALRRAGPAIIASAMTVALGMLCLYAAQLNSTKGLGPVASIGILVGLLAITTLLPAMLVIFGRWLFWPLRPKYGLEPKSATTFWGRIGNGIAKHPRLVWIVTTLVLAFMAYGLTDLKTTTLEGANAYRNTPDSVLGQNVLSAHFPSAAGADEPVILVGENSASQALKQKFASTPGISAVSSPILKGSQVLFEGTLKNDPTSQAAYNTVKRVRNAVHTVPNGGALVGGESAITLDTETAANSDQWVVMPLVLAVVFLILVILLRALTAPIILILTVVLSFASALGASSFIFVHVFHFAGTDNAFPLFVFIFLVALGIDYNIFLMTRVREETIRHGTHKGMLNSLAATGSVITSAGLVLAGTFAVLATLPLTEFAEIGFAVAFGVLLDTIIVRSVLVSAITLDVGRAMWWPSGLDKPKKSKPESPRRSGIAGDIRPKQLG